MQACYSLQAFLRNENHKDLKTAFPTYTFNGKIIGKECAMEKLSLA